MRVLASPLAPETNGNPYVALLHDELRANGVVIDHLSGWRLLSRPDIVHVHWPEHLVRSDKARTLVWDGGKVLSLIAAARLRGAALVWTAHNLEPHERSHQRLLRAFLGLFVAQVDLVIGLSAASHEALVERYPSLRGRPFVVIPHGHYKDVYVGGEPDRLQCRRNLGLAQNRRTLLMLGYIRPYKNVAGLVNAFVRMPEVQAQLAIVGRVSSAALAEGIRRAASDDERVRLSLSPASVDDIVSWHAASDVVVLPYGGLSSLNSGAALLALSLNRPVVMPDGPSARELLEQVGPEWLIPVDGDERDFVLAALSAPEPTDPEPPLGHLDWAPLASQTLIAYVQARERRRPLKFWRAVGPAG